MAEFRITSFLYSLILVGLFAGVFVLWWSDVNNDLPNEDYDSDDVEYFNRLNELSVIANSTRSEQESQSIISAIPGVDIVGSFFSKSYAALQTTKASFDIFNLLVNKGLEKLGLGEAFNLFNVAIITIILISIFVGVFISAAIKREI